ncbi:hypothetical protein [Capnocytophaga leadbetteri]
MLKTLPSQNKIKQDRTMNNLLTHYPVNWIDGMKLSSSHFIAVQDFVTDSVRDAIALQTTDLNYGLQPMAGDSVKIQVLMDHYNCLQLTLEECHAVTPNGIRIQISASQEGQTLTLSKDMTEMKGNATITDNIMDYSSIQYCFYEYQFEVIKKLYNEFKHI